MKLRAFLAVELSPACTTALQGVQQKLRKTGTRLKLVRKEAIHITLKFLGDIDARDVGTLQERLAEKLNGRRSFPFEVLSLGAFPAPERARVVFAAIGDGTANFRGLHDAVEEVVVALGVKPETRRYTPHVTLARLKERDADGAIGRVVHGLEGHKFSDEQAERVTLFESRLMREGPVYSKLAEFDLEA